MKNMVRKRRGGEAGENELGGKEEKHRDRVANEKGVRNACTGSNRRLINAIYR